MWCKACEHLGWLAHIKQLLEAGRTADAITILERITHQGAQYYEHNCKEEMDEYKGSE